ncbi:hypothetical protein C0Q70_17324 [Pomacea canaliculata]|uniref:Uncharacterized protein n=2 Tax=Pomacea canaliculata TaxID=400727 RepID=A0A2T7NK41_POMCA|nr:hypothetical protein C0Q70_17324 [Pomacea canaliculata]
MLITPGGVEINLNRNDDGNDISGHMSLPTDLPDKDSTGLLEGISTDPVTTSGNNDGGATSPRDVTGGATSPRDVANCDTTCTCNVAGWITAGVCGGLLATVAILCCRGRKKESKKPATTPVCTAPSSITTQERSEGSDPPVPAGIEPVRLATPGIPGIYWLRFRANKVVPQPLDV